MRKLRDGTVRVPSLSKATPWAQHKEVRHAVQQTSHANIKYMTVSDLYRWHAASSPGSQPYGLLTNQHDGCRAR